MLVVGDPFGATTHTDLVLRAEQEGIEFQVIHNASIINAVGCCGLQLYSYGETVSIPYWMDGWEPDSFYDKIANNFRNKMHTLCLLGESGIHCFQLNLNEFFFVDIKVKEPTLESLVKKKKQYMPPRFMSVSEAAQQLLQIIKKRKESQLELGRLKNTPVYNMHKEM